VRRFIAAAAHSKTQATLEVFRSFSAQNCRPGLAYQMP
jgi:hypothetical protein